MADAMPVEGRQHGPDHFQLRDQPGPDKRKVFRGCTAS